MQIVQLKKLAQYDDEDAKEAAAVDKKAALQRLQSRADAAVLKEQTENAELRALMDELKKKLT